MRCLVGEIPRAASVNQPLGLRIGPTLLAVWIVVSAFVCVVIAWFVIHLHRPPFP